MFKNLKTKNRRKVNYEDKRPAGSGSSDGFNHASGATTFEVRGNERTRLVRCRICGFPCDRSRNSKARDGSWAGLGITYGVQKTANSSIGDRRTPASGSVSPTPDNYYDRVVVGGCPACGSYTYGD